MRRLFVLVLLGVVPLAAADTPFVPAVADPRIGDWKSAGADGPVAQLSVDPHGDLQLTVLAAFDRTSAAPLAILRGRRRDDSLHLRGQGWTATDATEGRLTLERGTETHVLARVARSSPTLNAPPPEGAIVLFDGKSFAGWKTKDGKNWLQPSGPPAWKLVDGAMEVVPGADSLITERQFGDCTLHVEFRLLGAPTNSGVYLQARYEIDLNASYGRTEGNPCGSLGNCSPVRPSLDASRAPLEWQTLDVEFRAPRFDPAGKKTSAGRATVRLNGTLIYDQEELHPPKGAAGRLGEAPLGPLLLQEHGAPLQFRNVWIVPRAP